MHFVIVQQSLNKIYSNNLLIPCPARRFYNILFVPMRGGGTEIKMKQRFTAFYTNLSLKKKLILMLSVVCLIFMVFGTYISYLFSNNTLKNKSIAYTADTMNTLSGNIVRNLNNVTDFSQMILYNDTVYDIVKNGGGELSKLEYYENQLAVNNELLNLSAYTKEIQSVTLISGNNIYGLDINSVFSSSYDPEYDVMINRARLNHGGETWYLSNKKEIFQVRTIYNRNTNREIGNMIIKLQGSLFSELFSGYTNDLHNIILYSDSSGIIVSARNNTANIDFTSFFDSMPTDSGTVMHRKSKNLICYSSIKPTDWYVIILTPTDKLFKDTYILRNFYFIIYLLILAVIVFISNKMTKDILNPVNMLITAAKNFKNKNIITTVRVNRRDEFGYLSECFNQMALHITEMIHLRYTERVLKNEAQINALRAQINPHFIFNTLDTISWMVRMNKNDDAVEMISVLGSLMEVNAGKISNFIPLSSEIEYIKNYLLILKQRFRDKLTVKYFIPEEAYSVPIPSLILQPLIENSISHGIDRSGRNGVISLSVKLHPDSDLMIIEITDNGAGMDSDSAELLNNMLDMDNETFFKNVHSKNIGLENVNRRIKFFCGNEYGLHISSREGCYCKITCRISLSAGTSAKENKDV